MNTLTQGEATGTSRLAIYIDPEIHEELRQLAFYRRTSIRREADRLLRLALQQRKENNHVSNTD